MVDNYLVRNPREAAKAFSSFPKQRNVFLVKFFPYGTQATADQTVLSAVSFIAKSVERPKVNPKTEELHQYNKKRQVYTGYKLDPVRMQFYDDAQSSALTMWQDYAKYYFGDMNSTGVATSYGYDVTSAQLLDSGYGFGFTGNSPDGSGDFYFDRIEIYHFYNTLYDVYQLIHPRITEFVPDDLDYENSAVALISMSIVYENLQVSLKHDHSLDISNQPFAEFAAGATFDGDIKPLSSQPTAPSGATPTTQPQSSSTSMAQLFANASQLLAQLNDFRYNNQTSTGALGMFGNFLFGPPTPPPVNVVTPIQTTSAPAGGTTPPVPTHEPGGDNGTPPSGLTSMAKNNTALTAALNSAQAIDPLTTVQNTPQGTVNTATRQTVNGAEYDVALAQAMAATTGYGPAANTLTTALLASAAISGNGSVATPTGVVLTPQGYGTINAQQGGTAQYGFNVNTSPTDGESWGYTGPSGYLGPIGTEDNGPYQSNRPSGLYGRYGILPAPVGVA